MADNHENIEPPDPEPPQNFTAPEIVDAEIVDAEIIDAEIVDAEIANPPPDETNPRPAAQSSFPNRENAMLELSVQRLSAKGGAVGSVWLAVLGIAGMAFSTYSLFNVVLAAGFSIWGLKSPLRKTAVTGLLLSLAGLAVFFLKARG